MAATALSTGGIALHGAPDFDIGSKDAKAPSLQAMQLDIAQDIIDELLDSVRSGKVPQMIFGRTPVRVLSVPLSLLAGSRCTALHVLPVLAYVCACVLVVLRVMSMVLVIPP